MAGSSGTCLAGRVAHWCTLERNTWAVKAEAVVGCVMGGQSGSNYPAETHLSPFNPPSSPTQEGNH